jgi:alpha-galactosidase
MKTSYPISISTFIFVLSVVCTIGPLAIAADEIAYNRIWAEDAFCDKCPVDKLPFSFVYDGQPSRELIAGWQRTLEDRKIDESSRQRTLTLVDPKTGLEVRAVATIYTDTPGVDWMVHFTNRGNRPSAILEKVCAVDIALPIKGDNQVTLHRLYGSSAGALDWLPYDEILPPGKRIDFAPIQGRSSKGASPFFNLDCDGTGVITAIGWTGQWKSSISRGKDDANGESVRLQAGMQNLRLKLEPGETIRSPRILQLYWQGSDPYRPYNLLRQTMLAHISPRLDGQPVLPPIAKLSTAFYEIDKGTEDDILSHLDSAKDLGFEFFWFDAFCERYTFPKIGSYVRPLSRGFNPQRFPGGIKPIGQAVDKAGLKFLKWFEPERVCPDTLMANEHPEWIVMPEK